MIRLIIFDLWKTLAYRDVPYSTISLMLEKTGLDMPRDMFLKIFEETIHTKNWSSKHEAYRTLCKNLGIKATEGNIKMFMDIRDKAEEKTKLYEHTIPMLQLLKKQGYKLGLIANTSIFAMKQVRKTGLLGHIDYPLFSFDLGLLKPDLRVYTKMLEISGCKATETMVIGDNPDQDVIPPKKLGMNALLFTNYETLKKDLVSFGIHLDSVRKLRRNLS